MGRTERRRSVPMTPRDDAQEERTTTCLRVLEHLQRRVAMDEAIGILAADDQSEPERVRAGLRAEHGPNGEDAEAARVVARTEANARPQSDPDWY